MSKLNIQNSKCKVLLLLVVGITSIQPFLNLRMVYATTISLSNSGNGSDSENTAAIDMDLDIVIDQSNYTDIENEVDQVAETGENTAVDNSGSVDITTGEIESTTTIANLASTNEVDLATIPEQDITLANLNNATNASDIVLFDQSSIVNVAQTNDVVIANSISKDLNTGNNLAQDNSGPIKILTGQIDDSSSMQNTAGNNLVSIQPSTITTIELVNEGNGTDSVNEIALSITQEINLTQDNRVRITNTEEKNLNTGANECSDNQASCVIETGSITTETTVKTNTSTNSAKINPLVTPTPPTSPVPSTNTPTITLKPIQPQLTVTTTTTPIAEAEPQGGPLTQATPTPSPSEVPQEEPDQTQKKNLLTTIFETIVPKAQAAVDVLEEPVLGIQQLPVTGLGQVARLRWNELLLGIVLLLLGVLIKRPKLQGTLS